jgi:hypothetical protein
VALVRHDRIGDDRVGEDITFCHRTRNAGFAIWAHSGVLLDSDRNDLVQALRQKAVLIRRLYRDARSSRRDRKPESNRQKKKREAGSRAV